MLYEFRERAYTFNDVQNKVMNKIADLVERMENTIVGAVAITRVQPLQYTVCELSRNVKEHEICPSKNEVTGEIVTPTFSKHVFIKPRTWIATPMSNGGFNIVRR